MGDDPPSTSVLPWKTLGDVPRPRVIRDAFEELPDGLVDPTQASRIQISSVEIPKIRGFFFFENSNTKRSQIFSNSFDHIYRILNLDYLSQSAEDDRANEQLVGG